MSKLNAAMYAAALNTCAGPRRLPDGSWCNHNFSPAWSWQMRQEPLPTTNLDTMVCINCGAMVVE